MSGHNDYRFGYNNDKGTGAFENRGLGWTRREWARAARYGEGDPGLLRLHHALFKLGEGVGR